MTSNPACWTPIDPPPHPAKRSATAARPFMRPLAFPDDGQPIAEHLHVPRTGPAGHHVRPAGVESPGTSSYRWTRCYGGEGRAIQPPLLHQPNPQGPLSALLESTAVDT